MTADKPEIKPDKARLYLKHKRIYRNLLVVSIVALTFSTATGIFFFYMWSQEADKFLDAASEQNNISYQLTMAQDENLKLTQQLAIVRNPEINILQLWPVDSINNFRAIMFYNPYTGETFIDMFSLPFPADDMQYQLWAKEDTLYRYVAALNMEDAIQRVKHVSRVSQWAVSLEPKSNDAKNEPGQIILTSR
jgi:hypothetical protein